MQGTRIYAYAPIDHFHMVHSDQLKSGMIFFGKSKTRVVGGYLEVAGKLWLTEILGVNGRSKLCP
jgi:hypothetical protein